MIFCSSFQIGVCSWSLNNDLELLNLLRDKTGIEVVHLDLNPAINGQVNGYTDQFQTAGWSFSAAMVGFAQEDYSTLDSIRMTGGIVPDEYWPGNRDRVFEAIDLTAGLGIKYLEFHFGFIDQPGSEQFKNLAEKARVLADRAKQSGIVLLMETGQETAETLKSMLEYINHPSLAVNFDPGNMILYGQGEPVEAVVKIGKWIRHVHGKDAIASQMQGQWGKEVRWGDGQVNTSSFLKILKSAGFNGTIALEREAGAQRISDLEIAVERLKRG